MGKCRQGHLNILNILLNNMNFIFPGRQNLKENKQLIKKLLDSLQDRSGKCLISGELIDNAY